MKITRQWKSTLYHLRRRHQRGRQKSNRVRLATQQLCTCITLFCAFLCRRYTSTTRNVLISRFVEDGNPTRLTPEKSPTYEKLEELEKRAMKFKTAWILFLGEVFAAIPPSTHFDSEDNYRTGCRNVSCCQKLQSYSGLRSPEGSCSTYLYVLSNCVKRCLGCLGTSPFSSPFNESVIIDLNKSC